MTSKIWIVLGVLVLGFGIAKYLSNDDWKSLRKQESFGYKNYVMSMAYSPERVGNPKNIRWFYVLYVLAWVVVSWICWPRKMKWKFLTRDW